MILAAPTNFASRESKNNNCAPTTQVFNKPFAPTNATGEIGGTAYLSTAAWKEKLFRAATAVQQLAIQMENSVPAKTKGLACPATFRP